MAEKNPTVLEIYEQRGWLDKISSRWSGKDRLDVGTWIRNIHEKSGLGKVSAIDYTKERVDCSLNLHAGINENMEALFFKATKFIPKEFRESVIKVCCDNEYLKASGKTINEKKADRHLQIVDLCRGLDYLVEFRLFRKKNEIH